MAHSISSKQFSLCPIREKSSLVHEKIFPYGLIFIADEIFESKKIIITAFVYWYRSHTSYNKWTTF